MGPDLSRLDNETFTWRLGHALYKYVSTPLSATRTDDANLSVGLLRYVGKSTL